LLFGVCGQRMDYLSNFIYESNIKSFATGTVYITHAYILRACNSHNSEENMNWVYNALIVFKSLQKYGTISWRDRFCQIVIKIIKTELWRHIRSLLLKTCGQSGCKPGVLCYKGFRLELLELLVCLWESTAKEWIIY
jgi:hypothetical protein